MYIYTYIHVYIYTYIYIYTHFYLIFGNLEILHEKLLPNITQNLWITLCVCVCAHAHTRMRVLAFANLSLLRSFLFN